MKLNENKDGTRKLLLGVFIAAIAITAVIAARWSGLWPADSSPSHSVKAPAVATDSPVATLDAAIDTGQTIDRDTVQAETFALNGSYSEFSTNYIFSKK